LVVVVLEEHRLLMTSLHLKVLIPCLQQLHQLVAVQEGITRLVLVQMEPLVVLVVVHLIKTQQVQWVLALQIRASQVGWLQILPTTTLLAAAAVRVQLVSTHKAE
jgi:hypothetical protein